MNKYHKVILLSLLSLLFTSCSPTKSTTSSNSGENISSSSTFAEISDVADISSGDYILGRNILSIDKNNKKAKLVNYEMDYYKYKAKNGTLIYDENIKFVRFKDNYDAINIVSQNAYIYTSNGKVTYAQLTEGENSYSSTYQSINLVPQFVLPTYGDYISPKLTQNKIDEQGKKIPSDNGGYVQESFYLFLTISQDKAQLFVSDNTSTHNENPLGEIENYSLSFNAEGIFFKIPHKEGDKACSLTVASAETIRFINSYEKNGDYSGSGTFTLINNN